MSEETVTREQLRLGLLRVLVANHVRWGVPTAALRAHLVRWALYPTPAAVELELQYLADKGLLFQVNKQVSPENRMWMISAEGRDFLAEQPDA